MRNIIALIGTAIIALLLYNLTPVGDMARSSNVGLVLWLLICLALSTVVQFWVFRSKK